MRKVDYLKKILGFLVKPNVESLELSMTDVHFKDMFSLVIDGTEPGKLTRIFIAGSELKPFEVQLHSHRYPIKLTAIKGQIRQFIAEPIANEDEPSVEISCFKYKSPLNGGEGLSYFREQKVTLKDFALPIGSSIDMSINDVHTMSCSEGSIWIVEEQGFKSDFSIVLGVPFVTDDLYKKPPLFQVNDKVQLCKKEIKKLILDYETA